MNATTQDTMNPRDLAAHHRGRHLDFRDDANVKQDWTGIAAEFGSMAAHAWGRQCRDAGFHSDAQLASAAQGSLIAVQRGFYLKEALSKQWADGTLVTLTDQGVHPGDRFIDTNTMGARYNSKNHGIVAPDGIPERAVGMAEDFLRQNYKDIRDKTHITLQEIAEADKRGFSAMEAKGELMRREHDQNLNFLIRQGSVPDKLTGVTNHPGIRRYSALVDWGAASGPDIWDDWQAATNLMFASATEDGEPEMVVLPRLQWKHIVGEQYSLATDTTLRTWIDTNSDQNMTHDAGMNAVDSGGNPGALMYTNRADLIRVTMPYWMRMTQPFQLNEKVIRVMVESRFAGAQVPDVDKMILVEGTAAGWQATV